MLKAFDFGAFLRACPSIRLRTAHTLASLLHALNRCKSADKKHKIHSQLVWELDFMHRYFPPSEVITLVPSTYFDHNGGKYQLLVDNKHSTSSYYFS